MSANVCNHPVGANDCPCEIRHRRQLGVHCIVSWVFVRAGMQSIRATPMQSVVTMCQLLFGTRNANDFGRRPANSVTAPCRSCENQGSDHHLSRRCSERDHRAIFYRRTVVAECSAQSSKNWLLSRMLQSDLPRTMFQNRTRHPSR